MCACRKAFCNRDATICLSMAYRSWLVAPSRRGRGRRDYVACESRDVPEKRGKTELTRNSSGGYIVSQAVRRHALGDARGSGGLDADAVEVTRRERVDAILTRKQISLRPQHRPPVPQQFEQMRGQHCVAVLAPLA